MKSIGKTFLRMTTLMALAGPGTWAVPAIAEESTESDTARLDQLKGYGLTVWGERLADVERKTGKLNPDKKEGMYYRDTTWLGRPVRNHFTFFNGELVEVSLTLNDPQIQMEAYPDFYMQAAAFLKEQYGKPAKERRRLLEYPVMPMKEQIEKGYAQWFLLWPGKSTTIVLGMTPLEKTQQLVLYATYMPAQPLPSWPQMEVRQDEAEVPSAEIKPGEKAPEPAPKQ